MEILNRRLFPSAHPRRRRTESLGWLLVATLMLFGSSEVLLHGQSARDADLKAVFLFNFAHYVDWPSKAFPTQDSSIVIGVLGENPFDESLEEVVREEEVGGRKLVVKYFERIQDVENCHILYISSSEASDLRTILPALHGRSILTVGEGGHFAESGGMIEFLRVKKRIALVINYEAAKTENLRISSQVLRAARIVTTQR